MLCDLPVIQAQSSVNAAGGRATGTAGNVSYSIGQVNYIHTKNNDGTTMQGVQQPYEIYAIEVDSGNGNEFQIAATAYPNPASGFLKLRIDEGKIEDMYYRIYDGHGKLVTQQKIVSTETTISLLSLSNTFYFLKVYKSIFVVKSFKIVKSQ